MLQKPNTLSPSQKTVGDVLEYATTARKMHRAEIIEVLPTGYRVRRDDGVEQTIRLDFENFPPGE